MAEGRTHNHASRSAMTKLPSYLLRDEDLPRWQAAASSTGQSFADYVRDALDDRTEKLVKHGTLPSYLAPEKTPVRMRRRRGGGAS